MTHLRIWDICGLFVTVCSIALGEMLFSYEVHGRASHRTVGCYSNLRLLHVYLRVGDTADADAALPLSLVLAVRDLGSLQCPCKRPVSHRSPQGRMEVDYEYVGGGLTWARLLSVQRFPLAWDKAGNHADGSRWVLFANGRVELLREHDFQPMLREAIERCGNDDALKARLLPYVAPAQSGSTPPP